MTATAPTTLTYATRESGPLLLDLLLPKDWTSPVPVVVWVHGGGWFTGDRHLAPDLARHFAARGLAMASIDYRLSGEAHFPAQLHDVRAAVRHLRENADELGLQADAVGLWGSSAGGHLAALTGATGHLQELPGESDEDGRARPKDTPRDASVQAVVAGYGPVDLERVVESASIPALAGANAPERRLVGGSVEQFPELARAASPLTHVTAAAPPFLLAHGTADVLVPAGQSVLLHDALERVGVSSWLYLVEDFRHGFFNPAGAVEIPGPRVMDDGRLDAEPDAPAMLVTGGVEKPATFSFEVVGDFLVDQLLATPHG